MADAVQSLVAVWARAPQAVSPRLSAQRLRALYVVDRSPRINLTGFAEQLGMTMPTASRLCDRLQEAGLLHRSTATRNRREIVLLVTAGGRQLLDEVAEHRCRDLAAVLEAMPPSRCSELLHGLQAFHSAVRAGPQSTAGDPDER